MRRLRLPRWLRTEKVQIVLSMRPPPGVLLGRDTVVQLVIPSILVLLKVKRIPEVFGIHTLYTVYMIFKASSARYLDEKKNDDSRPKIDCDTSVTVIHHNLL